MKKMVTQFSCGEETVFSQGYKGFINIMVCKSGKIRDGVAKTIEQVNAISELIENEQNRNEFIEWAKKVIA